MRYALAPQGPVAAEMTALLWVLVGLGAAVFVTFAVFLGRGLFRRSEDSRPDDPHQRSLAVAGVALPTVIVVVVFGFTLTAMRATDLEAGELTIEIIGHQWWWELRYDGFATANEIVIPAGEPVEFEVSSVDVIHSFWVPELGGKIDMFPDYTNTVVLEADEPGEYAGACAEFCGLQHALMRLRVVAVTPDEYLRWTEEQQEEASDPADPQARRGLEVFAEHDCGTCHTVRGTAAVGTDGPDLTHLAQRGTLAAGTLPNDPGRLADWVRSPRSHKPGVGMPDSDLSAADIEALVAYLGTLR